MPASKMKRSAMPAAEEKSKTTTHPMNWIQRLEDQAALRKQMTPEQKWELICNTVNNLGLFEGYSERRKRRKLSELELF
jgi:hypothetical protein